MAKHPTSHVGSVFPLFQHLQALFKQHKARRSLPAILDLRRHTQESRILPLTCIMGAVTWEIKSAIWETQWSEPHPVPGPPRDFMFHTLSGLRYSTGQIRPSSPAIQGFTKLSPSFNTSSGGPRCPRTQGSIFLPALPALKTSHRALPPLACFKLCQPPYDLGHTLLWIS